MAKNKDFKKLHTKKTSNIKIPGSESADYDSLEPIFSLKYIRYRGPNCISNCQEDEKALILSTLLKLSQSTWKDLIARLSKEQGFESMPHFRFQVPIPMPPGVTPDTKILVARYDDAGRIAGYRNNDVYHIVLVGKDLYSH